MDALQIEGGPALSGSVRISGSKNAALPILMSVILADGPVRFTNIPDLRDIHTTLKLLAIMGCECSFDREAGVVDVEVKDILPEAPYELVKTMRASVLCLGPLLARVGQARVALPGGCAIGARPVDMHLTGLERMGASFNLDSGYIDGCCGPLQGAEIQFPFPTVGGTENLLMAAVLAKGESVINNAAREPEIVDLANFLIACGARIEGAGTSVIRVQGVDTLKGCEYAVMSDRIETGTYMVAAAITGGDLLLENCPANALDAVIAKLQEMHVSIEPEGTGYRVRPAGPLNAMDVTTLPYPGFPTDMQAQIMALMTVAEGSGLVEETIFENRFMHVQELARMGAKIKLSGRTALVRGVAELRGAPVMASDLRASASLVLAGLAAKGKTTVQRIYHLDRGYERMEEKLLQVGARIRRAAE